MKKAELIKHLQKTRKDLVDKKTELIDPLKHYSWLIKEIKNLDSEQRYHCLGCETILCDEDLREMEDRRVCDNCEEDVFVIFTDGGKYHQNLRRLKHLRDNIELKTGD